MEQTEKKVLGNESKPFENNQVSLVGEIASDLVYSHEVFGEHFYLTELSVSRLSGFVDRIPLMVSEYLIDVTKDYRGMCIRVEGQFRSVNYPLSKANGLPASSSS